MITSMDDIGFVDIEPVKVISLTIATVFNWLELVSQRRRWFPRPRSEVHVLSLLSVSYVFLLLKILILSLRMIFWFVPMKAALFMF